MRTLRSAMALLPAFLLAAALCGCAASPPGESPGSAPAKPVDATDFMSCAGPVFPLTLEKAAPELSADREVLLDCAPCVKTARKNCCRSQICCSHRMTKAMPK